MSTGGLNQGTLYIRFEDSDPNSSAVPTIVSQHVVTLDQLGTVLPDGPVQADLTTAHTYLPAPKGRSFQLLAGDRQSRRTRRIGLGFTDTSMSSGRRNGICFAVVGLHAIALAAHCTVAQSVVIAGVDALRSAATRALVILPASLGAAPDTSATTQPAATAVE